MDNIEDYIDGTAFIILYRDLFASEYQWNRVCDFLCVENKRRNGRVYVPVNKADLVAFNSPATFTFGRDYVNQDKVRAILEDAVRYRSDVIR